MILLTYVMSDLRITNDSALKVRLEESQKCKLHFVLFIELILYEEYFARTCQSSDPLALESSSSSVVVSIVVIIAVDPVHRLLLEHAVLRVVGIILDRGTKIEGKTITQTVTRELLMLYVHDTLQYTFLKLSLVKEKMKFL